jgi:hypothetical protein
MKKLVWVVAIILLMMTALFAVAISATGAVKPATCSGTILYKDIDMPVLLYIFGPGDGDGGGG